MSLPPDTAVRLRRAMKALGHGGGIDNAVIIVFSGVASRRGSAVVGRDARARWLASGLGLDLLCGEAEDSCARCWR